MATTDDVPEHIRQFILNSFDSVEQLRVLLLLFENPERQWTIGDLTRELRSAESSIAKRLEDLQARKILKPNPAEPDRSSSSQIAPELRESVRELAELNRSHPHRLMELIYSRPNESLRSFSDAFSFRKDHS